MSGHSKWNSIKHKKAVTDSKRSQLFSRLGRDIRIAARNGTDPANNNTLREAIDRAKKANLPLANIERILSSQAGAAESVTYEGHGVGGVALLIDTITNNTNRTVAEIRSIMKRNQATLGSPGSVRWQFFPRTVTTANLPPTINREDLELSIIEAGADDISYDENIITISASLEHQQKIESALQTANAIDIDSTTDYFVPPPQRIAITEENQEKLNTLISELTEHEDVVAVYTNQQH